MAGKENIQLNLVHREAQDSRAGMLEVVKEDHLLSKLHDIPRMIAPKHHEVRKEDVNLKRLGAVIALAQNTDLSDFESLLLLKGAGPRTIQSLALVSEVIHGTPSRFSDPARFSFAHGGKDGHPFPVPTTTYDETITLLESSLTKSSLQQSDRLQATKKLHQSLQIEKGFQPDHQRFDDLIRKERAASYQYGGRTVFGKAKPPKHKDKDAEQLRLF